MERYPRLGCAGVVRRDNEILLGVRDKEPNRGKLILPGGGVDYGEGHKETLRREMREEAGIEIEVGELIGLYELINEPDEHRVIVYRWGEHVSGEPEGSDDLADPRFYSRDEVERLVKEGETTSIVTEVLRNIGWAP